MVGDAWPFTIPLSCCSYKDNISKRRVNTMHRGIRE